MSNATKQYIVAITASIHALSLGLTIGWLSPNLLFLASEETLLNEPLTLEEVSWIGSTHLLCSLLGVVFFGYAMNTLGRKMSVCLVAVPFLVNWLFIIFGNHFIYLIAARVCVGLGAGGVFSAIPVYIAEISEDKVRGLLGSFLMLCNYFGCLVSYVISSFLTYQMISYIMLSVPAFALITSLIMLPETPMFLMRKGKIEDANMTLRWLRGMGKDGHVKDSSVEEALNKLKISTQSEAPNLTYKDFVSPTTLRGFFLSITILLIQQLSTAFAIMNFAGRILQESGSALSIPNSTIIVGALLFLGACMSTSLVERAGRRILLITSCIGVSAALLTLGTYTYMKTEGFEVQAHAWIPIAALSLCFLSFSCGLGPIPLVVISEMFLPKIRSLATSICGFIFWIIAFTVVRSFNPIMEQLGMHGCFWLFGSCMIFGAMFIFFFLPETKGRSVEDIIMDLSGGRKLKSVIV